MSESLVKTVSKIVTVTKPDYDKCIKLTIYDGNSEYADLCRDYWAMDGAFEYIYKVDEVVEKHGTRGGSILIDPLKKHSSMRATILRCVGCKEFRQFRNRADLLSAGFQVTESKYICDQCKESKLAKMGEGEIVKTQEDIRHLEKQINEKMMRLELLKLSEEG